MNECRCATIKVGGQPTESKNWNPDCTEHGVRSAWYQTPEQVASRKAQSERLRDLQQQAAEARRKYRESQ